MLIQEIFEMPQYLILLITGLVFSACGFYMYIYFFSLGYGFSIAAIGAVLLLLFRRTVTTGTALQCLLFIVYGIRLGGYLLLREIRSPAYKNVLSPEMIRSKKIGMGPKIAIWVSCAFLYTLETAPVFFRLLNGDGTGATVMAGAAIMLAGLALESAADLQKTNAKKKNPYRFVDTGLYRIVRCPNYLGEMIFWLGVLVSGFGTLHGGLQWGMAAAGFIGIVYIMFGGARRLEIRQDRNYGDDPVYQEYVRTVPILLPFVPLYSVKKYTFLVA
ncbi:MAG: DUF1295 domain-containing protein [Eubacteriales bacterium]|nr:DUF1295 domain-containing protein [Eubacteriales bacterium]